MLHGMEAVMCLLPGFTLADVGAVLRRHHVEAQPMHPGVADDVLARWYLLHSGSEAKLQAAVQELQPHAAVDAAMLKPDGEAPAG